MGENAVAIMDPRLVIEVDSLPAEGWAFTGTIPAHDVETLLNEGVAEPDLTAPDGMDAALRAYLAGEGLRLEGTVKVVVHKPCGRCIKDAVLKVDLPVRMTLFPAAAPKPPARPAGEDADKPPRKGKRGGGRERDRERESDDPSGGRDPNDLEDVDTATYRNGKADVAGVLREAVLLEVPFSLLCRPDCKGLCQRCGADLNDGPCGCPVGTGDPRLAVLGAIKLD
jgi:uncharacterized metal-binding protein YceD (DUF177 family)